MNKALLKKIVKKLTEAQGGLDFEIWDASGEDREILETVNDKIDELITEIECYMA